MIHDAIHGLTESVLPGVPLLDLAEMGAHLMND
jgi:hypothetical protein